MVLVRPGECPTCAESQEVVLLEVRRGSLSALSCATVLGIHTLGMTCRCQFLLRCRSTVVLGSCDGSSAVLLRIVLLSC